jgi:hypothetical protein
VLATPMTVKITKRRVECSVKGVGVAKKTA